MNFIAGYGRCHICPQVPGFRDKSDDVVLVIIYRMFGCNKRSVPEGGGGRGRSLPQAASTSSSRRRTGIRILTHFTIFPSQVMFYQTVVAVSFLKTLFLPCYRDVQ